MATNVLLLHYNNYFNRTIKKLGTVAEYKTADTNYSICNDVNFVPGDGITTSLVLGFGNNPTNVFDNGSNYDYLVVMDSVSPAYTIQSRWFIMEENRTRDGQYELTLKRDVIADNLDDVLNATTYIEKGWLNSQSKLIFNSEGLQLNQIKEREILLKDKSNCPWIVAYVAKNASSNGVTVNYAPANTDYIDVSASTIQNWDYYTYFSNDYVGPLSNIQFELSYQRGLDDNWNYGRYWTTFTLPSLWGNGQYGQGGSGTGAWNYHLRSHQDNSIESIRTALQTAGTPNAVSLENALIGYLNAHNQSELNAFMYYNGKTIKTLDGKYYEISIVPATGTSFSNYAITDLSSTLATVWNNIIATTGKFASGYNTIDENSLKISCSASAYRMLYTEVSAKAVTAKISSTRVKTKDALYDIICLPYGEVDVGNIVSNNFTKLLTTSKELSMAAINALAVSLTNASVYDIQLLPYCPVQGAIFDEGRLIVDTADLDVKYSYITDNSTDPATKIGIIFYATDSSFTFDIDQSLDYKSYELISSYQDVSSISTYQDYVVKTLASDLDVQRDTMGEYNITAIQNSNYGNFIKVKKINKTTGKILTEYYCARIELQLNTNNVGNTFTTRKATTGTTTTVIETVDITTYAAANYYFEFSIQSNTYASRGIDNVWPDVCQIPVINSELSETYNLKISNECYKYRLTSPNYQGDFEFSVAKNYGVDLFNVDCTYKPFNPYIHVNPNFKGLYGNDFNDGRGLVCNGDFSFGMIGDAFSNYELQNKTYQSVFNRQIENMDVNNAINRQEAAWQTAAGVVKSGAGGAAAGAMIGGATGAVAGAAIGSGLSLAGGLIDLANLQKRQAEARDFATDMYTYSLQNIQALPYSLTKCAALTANNKLYPFIEVYSASDEEVEAFRSKLKYDGFSVMKIDRLINYINQTEHALVRGQVIRFDESANLKSDAHMANEIYNEISKGVYL